ncbi:MAG TPA: hypothetical protein PLV42_00455 [bacterium]|nr:hypothetical protein [bacterium]
MSQQELLRTVVSVLDRCSIPYMLTGSVVSSIQGEPRSSHDIDIIVSIRKEDIPALTASFTDPRYYLDERMIRQAILNDQMFNLIDNKEGDKVDFWILTGSSFDVSRFSRRQKIELFGGPLYVSAPEDTILAKLRWSKLSGGSQKQMLDALRVFEVQRDILDVNYLNEWAQKMGLSEALANLLAGSAKT